MGVDADGEVATCFVACAVVAAIGAVAACTEGCRDMRRVRGMHDSCWRSRCFRGGRGRGAACGGGRGRRRHGGIVYIIDLISTPSVSF